MPPNLILAFMSIPYIWQLRVNWICFIELKHEKYQLNGFLSVNISFGWWEVTEEKKSTESWGQCNQQTRNERQTHIRTHKMEQSLKESRSATFKYCMLSLTVKPKHDREHCEKFQRTAAKTIKGLKKGPMKRS